MTVNMTTRPSLRDDACPGDTDMAKENTRQRKGNLPVLTEPPPQWLTDYTQDNHRKFNELLQKLERNERLR